MFCLNLQYNISVNLKLNTFEYRFEQQTSNVRKQQEKL